MTGWRRGRVFGAVVLTTGTLVSACGSFGGADDPIAPPATTEVDASAETTSEASAGECSPAFPDDFAGCKCESGSIRDCTHGKVGGESGCKRGSQTCANGIWATCAGATEPVPEICFDGIDNNCDGALDEGCPGTTDHELCGTLNDTSPHVSTDKASYGPGETVQFLVFWKTAIKDVHLRRADGYCAGGSGGGMVVSPGTSCASKGWRAYRRSIPIDDALFDNAPTTNIQILVNPQAQPPALGACTNAIATLNIDVTKQ